MHETSTNAALAATLPSRMLRRRTTLQLLVAALLAALLATAGLQAYSQGTARAQTNWEVMAGGGFEVVPGGFLTAMAYFPNPQVINVGDTVTWVGEAHTVTFLSGHGHDEAALILPGPGPGELMLGPGFMPINYMEPGQAYDGTMLVSSGFLEEDSPPFSLTFTEEGTFHYVCLLHPGMQGTIEVLAEDAELPETPLEMLERAEGSLRGLLALIHMQFESAQQPVSAGGVHAALVGVGDAHGASAVAMIPESLTVQRGDTVVWTNTDPFEIHTVAFVEDPMQAPAFVEPRFGPDPGPPTLVIPANVASPTGGTVLTGQGFLNSGILPYGGRFIVRVDAPAGTYQYICLVHGPLQSGTITVVE